MKVTIKAFVHHRQYAWSKEVAYTIDVCDMSKVDASYSVIRQQEFEVEIPDDFDPTPSKIAALKAKKQEILAEAHVKAENIEEQIQRLLCIEHKPEVEA
jgi:hypothetical protein